MKKTSFELVWEALVARPGMTTMEIVGEVSRSRARVRQALNRFLAEGRVCVSGYVYDFNRYVEKYAPGCRNAKRPSYGERDRFRVKKGKGTAISGTRARFDIWDGAVRAALRAAGKTAGTAAPETATVPAGKVPEMARPAAARETAGPVREEKMAENAREMAGNAVPETMKMAAGKAGPCPAKEGAREAFRERTGAVWGTAGDGSVARERVAAEETAGRARYGTVAGMGCAARGEAACR